MANQRSEGSGPDYTAVRGLNLEREFGGPEEIQRTPKSDYMEELLRVLGYGKLVRHPTGPIGSYMQEGSQASTTQPLDASGNRFSGSAPQWKLVGNQWFNMDRALAGMGDAYAGPTQQISQGTPLEAIPAMLERTSRPLGAGTVTEPIQTQPPTEGVSYARALGDRRAKAAAKRKQAKKKPAKPNSAGSEIGR